MNNENDRDNNSLSTDKVVKKAKSQLKIGLFIIIIIGLLLAIYFIIINPIKRNDSVISATILVTDRVGGGLCMSDSGDSYGCNTLLTIYTDGKYKMTSDQNNKTVNLDSGKIKQEELNNLKGLINQTNFEELKKHPFVGECQTAYDGSSSVYTFYISDLITETIGSCQYQITSDYQVFKEISKIFIELNK